MLKNMGNFDRVFRLTVMAVIGALYFTDVINGKIGIALMVLAGIFLATSLFRFCPLYFPFGIRTNGGKRC